MGQVESIVKNLRMRRGGWKGVRGETDSFINGQDAMPTVSVCIVNCQKTHDFK